MKLKLDELYGLLDYCRENGICEVSIGDMSFSFAPKPKEKKTQRVSNDPPYQPQVGWEARTFGV